MKALEPVRTLTLGRDDLHGFLRRDPAAAVNMLTEIARRLHKTDAMLRQSVSRNVNVIDDDRATFGQRVADAVATKMGSWTFIIVQSFLLACWVTANCLASLSLHPAESRALVSVGLRGPDHHDEPEPLAG